MKKVLIFGSTGSIGRNALKVIGKAKGQFKVIGLSANRDIDTLNRQIAEFRPSFVCLNDRSQAEKLKSRLPKGLEVFSGESGLLEFASLESDISLMAISGISCLRPLLKNIKHTKRIALANKESLVTAGSLVFEEAKKQKTEILPVDSEINALFQLFETNKSLTNGNLNRVYLTASGGALAGCKHKDLSKVTVGRVLAHPTWKMGPRITVDSATLVNKGFEVIETHFFFNLAYEKIDILIHRESMIHALIEETDGTLFACLYPPDMKTPISFALHYPDRKKGNCKVNFKNSFSCNFRPIRYSDYPLLKVTLDAAKRNDNSLVILNACDEVAISNFLKGKIKFTDIGKVITKVLEKYPAHQIKNINDVLGWDNWARIKAEELIDKL
ncbi:MAG: 1-deoxy-D-xylulose-5-phosphate reductoisomerase [Candidatus Omnitrophica bacterium]|nr:1-deoxy-D-xylulose-5-phosphate reductoisomerase [Candidatus Omnitrophota bacterium]MBU2473264.1 1-deoxy-D-xylulose-5-phosphate reductoisomerase [Candidatus Omnitrophota bacterium]